MNRRHFPGLVAALLCAAASSARAQASIRAFTPVITGHSVGGVTMDLVGNVYVADFDDTVWKLTPEGERRVFATGFYGASGNVIDKDGNLLQSNFYGNAVTRVDRTGHATPFVTTGLNGPVGITINRQTGDIYVANCVGNSVTRIAADSSVSSFAASELFHCPNGISLDTQGNLYVVNYRDNRMLKVDPSGTVTLFATVSDKGLGHLCFKDDRFYVTASQSHALYQVTLDGKVTRILGDGVRGVVDGVGQKARLSYPNGVACSPWVRRLFINEFVNSSPTALPRRAIVREINFEK